MPIRRARFWLWLLPALWAALIFAASADAESGVRTSRIIGPLVRWLAPDISAEALDQVVLLVRKLAHLTVYAVLAVLVWVALLHGTRWRKEQPRLPHWAWALLLTGAYAIFDELHQTTVPNRIGSVADVLLDLTGAAFGLVVAGLCRVWWRRRRARSLADAEAG